MKTRQITITVGVKIPVGYGHARYEVTEFIDMEEGEDRDQALKLKRIELTRHVYDHAADMRDRLENDQQARETK